MKRLLSVVLVATISFATTRVVCHNPVNNVCACDPLDPGYSKISDALSAANSGDEVLICPSTEAYNESALDVVNANLYIHSQGNDPSLVTISDDSGDPIFYIKATGVKIEGLNIVQNSSKQALSVYSSDFTLKNSVINSPNSYGIEFFEGMNNLDFENLEINSSKRAFYFKDDLNNSTFNTITIQSQDKGFDIKGDSNNSIFENIDINSDDRAFYFEGDLNNSKFNNITIQTQDRGFYIKGDTQNSSFNELNVTSNEDCFKSYGDVFKNVTVTNSEFNQTSTSYKVFYIKGNPSEDVNFSDINISSQEYGIYFYYDLIDANFTKININSVDYSFKVGGDIKNMRLIDSNITSQTDRAFYGEGSLVNGYFNEFNLTSGGDKGLYVSDDINNSVFKNFEINGTYGIDSGGYEKNNTIENGEINASKYGIYFKTSINNFIKDINITKPQYGIKMSTSSSGDIIENVNIVTSEDEPIYLYDIEAPVALYDLNLTSPDNCIYVSTLDANLDISTVNFYENELNCSGNNGIQISNDSSYSIKVDNTHLISSATSASTSYALIKASSLHNLSVNYSSIDGNNVRRGIYISSSLDNLYVYNSVFVNGNDSGIYIKQINDSLDIEDNNITNNGYGIYIYSVGDNFSGGNIKENYFRDNSDYAIYIKNNDNIFHIWTNCFYDNQNTSGESQAYTDDSSAEYNNTQGGNFWSDWNQSSDKYAIDPIPIYDYKPLYYCPLNNLFDARDTDKNFPTISIKIAGEEFNLTVFYTPDKEYNGTVCAKVVKADNNDINYTGWRGLNFENQKEKNLTDIEVNHSVRDARIYFIYTGKKVDCNVLAQGNENDYNTSISTDTFAIRPLKYNVKLSKMPLYAGEEFDVNVSAVDYNKKLLNDYNRSDISIKADMNITRLELNCAHPHAEFNLSELNFTNGESNNTAKFDDVGEMNLSIVDNDFDLAQGGENECNDSNECIAKYGYDGKDSNGVFCCNVEANPKWDVNLSEVDIKVYDLNITNNWIKTLSKSDWIYMSSYLNEFNASPTVEITAFNKEEVQLKNFDGQCLAKDMNISFTYDKLHNDNGDINLTYKGTLDDNNKSIYDFNKSIEVNKSIFVKGDTNASYSFNIDRNDSKPLYVVYAHLRDINFTTNGIAKNENNITTDRNISMYYGSIKTFDLMVNKNDVNVTVYFTVYDDDSDYKPSSENEAVNWYLNSKHNNDKEGNLSSKIYISDGYTAKDEFNNDFNVSVYDVSEGEEVIEIKRINTGIHFAVFHLVLDGNASKWLWYSYDGNDYNDSNGSTCAHHFCFAITWQETNGEKTKEVEAGKILGTEANVTEYNRTSKGVKIYR